MLFDLVPAPTAKVLEPLGEPLRPYRSLAGVVLLARRRHSALSAASPPIAAAHRGRVHRERREPEAGTPHVDRGGVVDGPGFELAVLRPSTNCDP